MLIRPATRHDIRYIAELALMAGEGIPAFFWAQSQQPGEDILDVGARNVLSETENFSYRNVQLAIVNDGIAGMLLAYRLPATEEKPADLNQFPAFIRPLIELEQCVPGSFYINMLATYPQFRRQGVATALLERVNPLARQAGCTLSSIEVFDENDSALRLYERLGYQLIEQRPVVAHISHPYHGNILLLTRAVP